MVYLPFKGWAILLSQYFAITKQKTGQQCWPWTRVFPNTLPKISFLYDDQTGAIVKWLFYTYICSLIFLKSSKSCNATESPSAIRLQLSAPPPMNLCEKKYTQYCIIYPCYEKKAINIHEKVKFVIITYWMLSIHETNSKAELVGAWHWTYDSGAQSTVLNTTRPYCVPPY